MIEEALEPTSISSEPENVKEKDDIIILWIFRLMAVLGGHKLLLLQNYYSDDFLASTLGLACTINSDSESSYDMVNARAQLFNHWKEAESNKHNYEFKNTELDANIRSLGNLVNLNKAEQAILKFAVSVHNNQVLENAICMLGHQNVRTLSKIFSICLEITESEAMKALHPEGLLSSSGILTINSRANYDFFNKVELLNGLVDSLEISHKDPSGIFRNLIQSSPISKLSDIDYPHLNSDIQIIKQYLQKALISQRKGVNFLIYGIPGTGKTEFVRTISKLAKTTLYEVASSAQGMKFYNETDRFKAYTLGQILYAGQGNSCILYDEVEYVFKVDDAKDKDNGKSKSKAWMNHLLENNSVPTFWVSNSILQIDPAFIRRFDYVLEIKSPPRSLREKILNNYLEDLPVSDVWKQQMAENEALVPAIIERSANVARISGMMQDQSSTESALQSILGNTIEAMGYRRPKQPSVNKLLNYRLDVLNTNHELADLCNGLKQNNEARVCLYGPSGTGKTAFGKYIAESLDVPLITKRASDIVSSFWGGTEENMAKMFAEAKQERAILMLDEADTFLSHRTNAKYNWEVSAVNEMLTQMESFDGLFIASTNYIDMIDSAAMRRFDIKLKFDYMKLSQVEIMFSELARQCNLKLDSHVIENLRDLEHITPGDFAAVKRKLRLVNITEPKVLFHMLKEECQFKNDISQRKMGFH